MTTASRRVVVVGAGLAGLCAALSAREHGAEVLVLEASPRDARGGNSRFSNGSFRFAHDGLHHDGELALELLIDVASDPDAARLRIAPYTRADFRDDILRTSHNRSNPDELDLVVDTSFETLRWLRAHGVSLGFNLKFSHVQEVRSTDSTTLDPGACVAAHDSGEGLMESLFGAAEAAGVTIRYDAVLQDLLVEDGRVAGVHAMVSGQPVEERGTVVLASGGFEANPEMRRKYLGRGWDLVAVRGSRYNTGLGLTRALEIGAMPGGHWGGCHSVPTDADIPLVGDLNRSPRSERYSYADGILVNELGERFVDEGEDLFTMTYTKVGAAICDQPAGLAYQVFDARTSHNLQQHYYSHGHPTVADTLEELALAIGVPVHRFTAMVAGFNEACATPAPDSHPEDLGAAPAGQPAKSHWALPIDRPPFVAYKVTSGISFTYGGIITDTDMAVLHVGGHRIGDLFAAGGVVGGLFYHNYPAAAALTRAAVCGRRAGRSAAGALAERP